MPARQGHFETVRKRVHKMNHAQNIENRIF